MVCVGRMTVREDGSIRDQSNPAHALTKVGTGQFCIKAADAQEGAVGSIQIGGASATIQASEGVGSFCNTIIGANITGRSCNLRAAETASTAASVVERRAPGVPGWGGL